MNVETQPKFQRRLIFITVPQDLKTRGDVNAYLDRYFAAHKLTSLSIKHIGKTSYAAWVI